ncbi:hypothetical protein P8452_27368 [Trifolium repens]|nr:hypothetical protein P8452_27368 [Trifolium repens]
MRNRIKFWMHNDHLLSVIATIFGMASKSSPGEFLRAEMLYKCGNLMLGCWRHYWGLLEATGIDLKVVGNTQSQYKASYQRVVSEYSWRAGFWADDTRRSELMILAVASFCSPQRVDLGQDL